MAIDGDGWIACLGWGDSIDGAGSGECFKRWDECLRGLEGDGDQYDFDTASLWL